MVSHRSDSEDSTAAASFDLQEWLDALSRADTDALRATATEDMIVETVGSSALAGRRTFSEFSENLAVIAEITQRNLAFSITEVTVEDNRMAVEFTGRAKLPDGTVFDEVHFVILYLRDGKIYRVKKYAESELVESVFGSLARRRVS